MPRIARDPVDSDAYDALCDAGSSTFDLCADCYDDIGGDGAPWPHNPELAAYNGEPDAALVGGYEVTGELEHPNYDDEATLGEPYHCAICDRTLMEVNDA